MADGAYGRVHVVINPASGKDEPILNVLNDVFREHGVAWDASVTHKYGDAGDQARAAIADGVDLVVAYGGDGTQHEVANAVVGAAVATGRRTPMGILPGGTGNGFAREVGVPNNVRDATVLLCTSKNTRAIDVGRLRSVGEAEVNDKYFIQRLYIGTEPEEQTSRELKDRYGVFAYVFSAGSQVSGPREFQYQVEVDGDALTFPATKVYMVNSGMTGSGFKVTQGYSIDDGLLDCFVLDKANTDTLIAAAARALDLHNEAAQRYYRQARSIKVKVEPDQPVWTDGEYIGRTPLSVDVLQGALTVVVPNEPQHLGLLHRGFDKLYPAIRFTYERLLGHVWFSQVTPTLWLGGAPTYRRDYDLLLGAGITAVVDVRAERTADPTFFEMHDIAHRQYRVPDVTVPDEGVLTDAVAWISAQILEGRVVLIHCAKGRGRSATVLAAYLMDVEGMTFDEVEDLLTSKRKLVKLQDRHRRVLESWIAQRRKTSPGGDAPRT